MMTKNRLILLMIFLASPLQAWWMPDNTEQWLTVEVVPKADQQLLYQLGDSRGIMLFTQDDLLAALDNASGNYSLSIKSRAGFDDTISSLLKSDNFQWEVPPVELYPAKKKVSGKKKDRKSDQGTSKKPPQKPTSPAAATTRRIILINVPDETSNLCFEAVAFGKTVSVTTDSSPIATGIQISQDGSSITVFVPVSLITAKISTGEEIGAVLPLKVEAIEIYHDIEKGIRYFKLPDSPEKNEEQLARINKSFSQMFIRLEKNKGENKDKDPDPDPETGAGAAAISE